jgi:hypothetical protein
MGLERAREIGQFVFEVEDESIKIDRLRNLPAGIIWEGLKKFGILMSGPRRCNFNG